MGHVVRAAGHTGTCSSGVPEEWAPGGRGLDRSPGQRPVVFWKLFCLKRRSMPVSWAPAPSPPHSLPPILRVSSTR